MKNSGIFDLDYLEKILDNIEIDRAKIYEILGEFIASGNQEQLKSVPKILDAIIKNNEQLIRVFLSRKSSGDGEIEEEDEVENLYDKLQSEQEG